MLTTHFLRFAALPLALAGLLAGATATAAVFYPDDSQNFITNGSFESQAIASEWQYVDPDFWSSSPSSAEIMRLWNGNSAAHGNQWVELDARVNVSIYQDVYLNQGRYMFTFHARNRPGTAASTNGVSAFAYSISGEGAPFGALPNAPLVSRVVEGTNLSFDAWSGFSDAFTVASDGWFRFQLSAGGTSDSLGSWVDAVSVTVVPVPPAAALGLVGLAMVAGRRLHRSRAQQ